MKLKPPYKHLVQKPYLCAPTCLQMVILRRNLGWIDQEEIAYDLRAKISADVKKAFTVKLSITRDKNKIAGLRLREFKQKKAADFFRKHKLPLKTEVVYISEVKDLKAFLETNLAKDNDVAANFWMVPFDKKEDWGHFALISQVLGDKITLCDPARNHKSFWDVGFDKLVEAMGKQFDGRERGFVVFSKT